MKKNKTLFIATSILTTSVAIAIPIFVVNSANSINKQNNEKDSRNKLPIADELDIVANNFDYDFIDLDKYFLTNDTDNNINHYLFLGSLNKDLYSKDFKEITKLLGLTNVDLTTNFPVTYKATNNNFKSYSLLKKVLDVKTMHADNKYTDNDEFYEIFNNPTPNSFLNYKIDFVNNNEIIHSNWLNPNEINYCFLKNKAISVGLEYIRTIYNNGQSMHHKLLLKINYDKSHYWSNNTNHPITFLLSDQYN